MARLNSWLSPDVLHALGWALVHSLWQCLAVAALAAATMAFVLRPALRYLIGVGALALMLAASTATFLLLLKHVTPDSPIAAISTNIPTAPPIPAAAGGQAPNFAGGGALNIVTQAPPVFEQALAVTPNRLLSPDILPWLVASWLCGVVFFSLRVAGGFLLLEHKRRSQSAKLEDHVLALCLDVQRQLGLDRVIRYMECAWLQAPAVIGWLRPMVLVPATALTGLSEAQLRAVIAHELAHIRRFDALVNLFQVFAETLLFYHPAIWWLNRRIRAERELCCDEIAVAATGSRLEYAQALTLMAAWESAPSLAMAVNRGPLSQRILHILGRNSRGAGRRLLGVTGSILFFIAALAAANALLDIAAPPIAQAKETVKAALSASQANIDRFTQQVFQATQPEAKVAVPQSDPTIAGTETAKKVEAEKLQPPALNLSGLLPQETLTTPTVLASAGPPVATDGARTVPAGVPEQPPAAPARIGVENPPSFIQNCRNNHSTGRVVSAQIIQMPGFACSPYDGLPLSYGKPGCGIPSPRAGCQKLGVTVVVQLEKPEDADKMHPGNIVTVYGNYRIARKDHADYVVATHARVEPDPFGRSLPDRDESGKSGQPDLPSEGSPAPKDPLKPASIQTMDAPPAPAAPSGPLTSAGATTWPCRNTSVLGRIVSPKVMQVPAFVCLGSDAPSFYASHRNGPCPEARPDLASANRLEGAVAQPCLSEVRINLGLADPADAGKMERGKTVRLGGAFRVVRRDDGEFIAADNVRPLQTDLVAAQDATAVPNLLVCQPPQLADLSRQFDQRLCVQSDIVSNLSATRPQLEGAVRVLVAHADANPWTGDPNAITCHKRIYERLPSSVTCGFNSFWKSWVAAGPALPGQPAIATDYGASGSVQPAMIGGAVWNGR